MPRAVFILVMSVLLWGCSTRDCCCPQPRNCPTVQCTPSAPPPSGVEPTALQDEKLKAAMAGIDQWFYDEVYTANRDLQACLLKASQEKDPAAAKKSHDQCVAQFKAKLDAVEKSLDETRKMATEAIMSSPAGPSQPPLK